MAYRNIFFQNNKIPEVVGSQMARSSECVDKAKLPRTICSDLKHCLCNVHSDRVAKNRVLSVGQRVLLSASHQAVEHTSQTHSVTMFQAVMDPAGSRTPL